MVLAVFAGLPGVGKSTLLLEVAADTDQMLEQDLKRAGEDTRVPCVARFGAEGRIEVGTVAEARAEAHRELYARVLHRSGVPARA